MVVGNNKSTTTKIQANHWQFQLPCGCSGTTRVALPDGGHSWLHVKPLDATIGRVAVPHCPCSRHVHQFQMKHTKR